MYSPVRGSFYILLQIPIQVSGVCDWGARPDRITGNDCSGTKSRSKHASLMSLGWAFGPSITQFRCRPFEALNIEHIQYWTFRCDFPRASGNGFRQQAFQPFQVIKLGADIFEMMRCDRTDLSTCSLFWSAKTHQRSDFLKRESEFSRSPYEGQGTDMRRVINPSAARRAWRRRQHLDPLVIADGLDVNATQAR